MKRVNAIILSLIMLLSITAMPASAIGESEEIGASEHLDVDLPAEGIALYENDMEFKTLDAVTQSYQELDFSNAINVTSILLSDTLNTELIDNDIAISNIDSIMPLDLPENQAPVGSPEIILMNSDSIRDGQFTTASIFFLATRWNNTDLCYDPEGGPLEIIYNDSFPKGYITEVTDQANGTYAGYLIHIFNRGNYPFAFVLADMYGAHTEISYINFEIVNRGVFETINGSLDLPTSSNSHTITVDYSSTDTYCLSLLRRGAGGLKITIFDQAGAEYASYTFDDHSRKPKWCTNLDRPEGITGPYSYTVKVSAHKDFFSKDDTAYRLTYGAEDQKAYFFEDISDCTDLLYFVQARKLGDMDNMLINDPSASDYGDYYKITTTGPETVTLVHGDGKLRFKILSATTLETLYDGYNLQPYYPYGTAVSPSFEVISATINFAAGESYYVVVYNPNDANVIHDYWISVGQRQLISRRAEYTVPEMSIVKGSPVTFSFDLTPVTGLSGYVKSVSYSAGIDAYLMHGNQFSIMNPGTSTWKTSAAYTLSIDFGYESGQPLVNCGGTWQFRLTPTKTGTYPGGKITIYYMCEI